MGGIFSSIRRDPDTQELHRDENIPFRFLDLPAELRALTYDYVLSQQIRVELELWINPRYLVPGQDQRLLGYLTDGTGFHRPDLKFSDNIQPTISLMNACRTTHVELGPRLYRTLRFVVNPASVAKNFCTSLSTFLRPFIHEMTVIDYPYRRYYTEKAEKLSIQAAVEGFSGLRILCWEGIDISANSQDKGTMWKPQELRKLAIVIKSSAHLRKAFYVPPSGLHRYTSVRLTTEDGTAKTNVSAGSAV